MTVLTREQYLSTYLDQTDLPGMSNTNDMRFASPNPNDSQFAANNGLAMGRMVWTAEADDAVIWQIMDIRFAFPEPVNAVDYHRARLPANAEGAMPVSGAASVGSYCATFGGVRQNPLIATETVTHFYYLFVVDCIVVKLFAAQSPVLPPATLTIDHLTPIAQAAGRRIAQVLVGHQS